MKGIIAGLIPGMLALIAADLAYEHVGLNWSVAIALVIVRIGDPIFAAILGVER